MNWMLTVQSEFITYNRNQQSPKITMTPIRRTNWMCKLEIPICLYMNRVKSDNTYKKNVRLYRRQLSTELQYTEDRCSIIICVYQSYLCSQFEFKQNQARQLTMPKLIESYFKTTQIQFLVATVWLDELIPLLVTSWSFFRIYDNTCRFKWWLIKCKSTLYEMLSCKHIRMDKFLSMRHGTCYSSKLC